MFTGEQSARIREILISEPAWEEMTCLFALSLDVFIAKQIGIVLSHDVERMVEMFAQAYKAGYRVSFVGC